MLRARGISLAFAKAGRGISSGLSFFKRSAEDFALKPVPTRPMYTNSPFRYAPASSERRFCESPHQPPTTISCPPRHFALVQSSLRPERYGESARLEITPSRPILQAA